MLSGMNPDKTAFSIGFVSFGCAKNLVDSQIMAGALVKSGIALAKSPEDADIVIVNTCSFIEEARKEAVETIREVCGLKKAGQCRAVLVAGCLPQRYGARLRFELPEVDAFIGVDEIDKVAGIVKRLAGGERGIVQVPGTATRLFDPDIPELVFTGGPYAYLKIAEGCNHHCAFCAIPEIRGRYRSRSLKAILAEAEALLNSGIRELNLISQDTMSYGRDLADGSNLPALLKALGGIGGRFWIRLLYGHPSGLTDELLAAIGGTPQVCRYLDIPIQHSDGDILRAMKRGGTTAQVQELVRWVKNIIPAITLRTTCLVGFPGETEDGFRHLQDFITKSEFDHIGVFTYSPEEGTAAYDLTATVAHELAQERSARIMQAQAKISLKKNRALIGTRRRVLVDGMEDMALLGRLETQAPEIDGMVYLSEIEAEPGEFVDVVITDATEYDLMGTSQNHATGARRKS
jgi:ribosomal protein S12 methylthiotransferase